MSSKKKLEHLCWQMYIFLEVLKYDFRIYRISLLVALITSYVACVWPIIKRVNLRSRLNHCYWSSCFVIHEGCSSTGLAMQLKCFPSASLRLSRETWSLTLVVHWWLRKQIWEIVANETCIFNGFGLEMKLVLWSTLHQPFC